MGAPVILTAAMIAGATGGALVSGDPARIIGGVSIDSRTLRPGDLFVPIVAARDGHEFLDDALARGACGALLARGSVRAAALRERWAASFGVRDAPVLIEVSDTTAALQDLARAVRRASGATVIAITGSAGKTTTKEAIAELIGGGGRRVVKNPGNLNNHLGLPLSLLELRHGADVAVMELGMNHPGEIRLLVGIARPEIRVWTNVGDAHLGHFASREAIADAKAEILEGAAPSDVLVCNADDPLVMARATRFAGRRITFGFTEKADVRAEDVVDCGLDGTRATIRTSDGAVQVHVPLLGRGNLANVLAAAAAARAIGVELPAIASACARLRPAAHRGAVLRLPRGIVVIDDSYNSSPQALARALEVVAHERSARRKAAVLGEMLELGDQARRLHEECGEAAARAGLDRLIAVGGDPALALADAARRAGLAAEAVSWTASSAEAAELIVPWLDAGDLLLVKGSRGIRTDLVVERVVEAFA
jgi:UDP-N-acetylmuramoyl-tripeptide--D-alanyl-D-alanine ligase